MRDGVKPKKQMGVLDAAGLVHPPDAHSIYKAGLHALELGQLEQAAQLLDQAIQVDPKQGEFWVGRAGVHQAQDNLAHAEACYRQAVQLRPCQFQAYVELGRIFLATDRLIEAEAMYRCALTLTNNTADRESAQKGLLQVEAASVRSEKPAAKRKQNPFLRLEENEHALRQLLAQRPDYAQAHNNLGVVLKDQGRLKEAEQSLRRALQIKPDYAGARWMLGTVLLAGGELSSGWAEYEWRFAANPRLQCNFGGPIWRGENIHGRTILLTHEQGLGDTLQFVRYASLVANLGAKVLLLVPEPLRRLMQTVAGVDQVFSVGEPLPTFDFSCPMLSLPNRLNTQGDSIPGGQPYVTADAQQVRQWATRLAQDTVQRPLRVGLAWAGNPRRDSGDINVILTDARRSLRLSQLAALASVDGVIFYSLQKGEPAAQAKHPPQAMRLIDHTHDLHDFADTAALVMNLDLVITVDTSVAHLAAAMGKPVWLLNRFDSCWRWMLDTDRSAWYPSMRLFRQPEAGQWAPVIAQAQQALQSFATQYALSNIRLGHSASRAHDPMFAPASGIRQRVLIIHQNFPGQFVHIANYLAQRPDVEVIGLGRDTAPGIPGFPWFQYTVSRKGTPGTHHYLHEMDAAVLRGQAVVRALQTLQKKGFTPDTILSHPGWGETLYAKEVFPQARLIHLCEWYYSTRGADVGFDPEFPVALDTRLRVGTRNALHLLNLQQCDAAIAPTQWQKSQFPAAYHSKIEVIHEGIDTQTLQPNPHVTLTLPNGSTFKVGEPTITYVARELDPYRGFHSFMRALPQVLADHPTVQVLIVGGDGKGYGAAPKGAANWREKMLAEVGAQLGENRARIHFLGKVPRTSYTKILQVSAVHVYLSYPFVLSWSLLEALSVGCRVIASDTPPVCEVIRDGDNAELVDFFDTAALARKIGQALREPDQGKTMRASARCSAQAYARDRGLQAYTRALGLALVAPTR